MVNMRTFSIHKVTDLYFNLRTNKHGNNGLALGILPPTNLLTNFKVNIKFRPILEERDSATECAMAFKEKMFGQNEGEDTTLFPMTLRNVTICLDL